MAYIPFYNKYRPQTFDEVVGQEAVITTLKNSIKDNKISHAYLFCGPRGTGKTTMARIFAKALNCEKGQGTQCNECSNCKSITIGDHPDVIEIDAASNSSVESVRDLIENVAYQPIKSKYKIYIIDEVHNMSNAAFNALLKTLEEPPDFVIFILATTEPQKIIPTILSRVQRFDFEKISNNLLIKNMENILKKENVKYDENSLKTIASLSDGGVRDSLSLLDQLVSYAGNSITVEDVNKLFGLMSIENELKIIDYIEKKDIQNIFQLLRDKVNTGIDIIKLHQDLIDIYKDLLLFRVTNNPNFLEMIDSNIAANYPISNTRLSYYIDQLVIAKREYKNTDNLLSHLQITLLKLTDSISPVEQKKEKVINEPKLISEPSPVSVNTESKTFIPSTPIEEKIKYTKEDVISILNLCNSKEFVEKRVELSNNWSNIKGDGKSEFISILIKNSHLRAFANNILLVTSLLDDQVNTLQKISNQPLIKEVIKSSFNNEYNLLCISYSEFKECYTIFSTKVKNKETISSNINIQFDQLSKRDEFMKEILDD